MPSTDNSAFGAYVAGALGGAAGQIVGHPFDTTKVQMQINSGKTSTTGTMAYISEQGWARGFFRGLSFPLASYAAINSVFFGVYNYALRVLHTDPISTMPSYATVFAAGGLGGAAQLVVACPSDVVKVVLQSQIPDSRTARLPTSSSKAARPYYSGPRQCIMELIRRGGLPSLYRGIGAMAARDVPGYAIYLVLFEFLDHNMHQHGLTDSQGIFANIMAGGLAGSLSWAAILPFDVIKSRIQADEERKYKGFLDCLTRSYREEGWRVFTRGLLVCSVRGFPSAAITFLVYAQTLKFFNNYGVVSP